METKVLSSGFKYENLPEGYVRPESERPRLSEVSECENIPVINLASENRAQTVQQVGDACKSYGFFQVINHGVSTEAVEKMLGTATEFFSLPVEEKMKLYSDDPSKTLRLSTSFNVNKEKVQNWRDYLRLHCYPLDKYVPEWPSNPSSFKDIVSKYCEEVRELGFRLQELISESLGLEKDYIKSTLGEQGQHMAVNFYPPRPQPELTYGLPGHTDPNALTILLQDLGVAGFQVLKDGKWAFVINFGDQLQGLWLRLLAAQVCSAQTMLVVLGVTTPKYGPVPVPPQLSSSQASNGTGGCPVFINNVIGNTIHATNSNNVGFWDFFNKGANPVPYWQKAMKFFLYCVVSYFMISHLPR